MAAEISEIVSKEAIQSIKDADSALVKFDGDVTKLINSLKGFSGSGTGLADLNVKIKETTDNAKKLNEVQKQQAKITADLQKAGSARAAAMDKEIAKEKELAAAIKLEVKSIEDAQRQNKALTEVRKKLDLTTAQGKKTLQDYNATMTKNTEFIRANGTAMEKQRMNIGNYKSAFDGIGAKLAGAFSVTAVLAFGRASFKAFEDQEQANRKLLFSLRGNKAAFNELTAQANAFQSKTGIADDAIQGIQVLGAEAGKSTEDIKKITEATINWSKLTGQDLQSAYLQINATLNGTAGRLTRVDSAFGTLTESQLKSGAAIDLINEKYKGFAENAASETDKLSANWSELQESAGGAIGGVINPLLRETSNLLNDINTKQGFWQKTLTFLSSVTPNSVLGSSFDAVNAAKSGKKTIDTKAIRNSPETQAMMTEAANKALAASAEITKKQAAENKKVTTGIKEQVGAYAKLTQSISDTKEQINNLLALGQTPSNELLTKLQQDEQKLKDVAKAAEFAGLKLIAMQQGNFEPTLTAKGLTGVSSTAKGTTSRLVARDNGSLSGAPTGTETFAPGELQQLAIDSAQATSDATFEIIANAANAELNLKLSNLDKETAARLKNTKLTEAQKIKIQEESDKKAAKLKTEAAKKEKAAAIIQAIINTALAISKAAPNPAMMILAGIVGAAQVAVIAAQKIPQFDKGTLSTPDTFIAGEKRPEFLKSASGKISFVSKPTMFTGMANSTVISGETTDRIMKAAGQDGLTAFNFTPAFNRMETQIVEAIKSQHHISISGRTGKITDRSGNYHKEYFNRLFKA